MRSPCPAHHSRFTYLQPRPQRPATGSAQRRTTKALVPLTLLALTAAFTGCSSDSTARSDSNSSANSSAAASPAATPSDAGERPVSELEATIDAATSQTAHLNLSNLPAAPAGFTAADVRAFAKRAVELIERGSSPDLTGKSPTDAFNYVFANQYPDTKRQAANDSQAAADGYDWQWAWATQFATRPLGPPTILDAQWQVQTVPGELPDGTAMPRLQVVLSTATKHLVADDRDPSGPPAPIVVKRAVIVDGYRPRGGPLWWPAVGVQTETWFGGKCAPSNGSVMTPAHRPSTLKADLRALQNYLSKPPVKVDTGAVSTANSIGDYLRRYCED